LIEYAVYSEIRKDVYRTSVGGWKAYKEQLRPMRAALLKYLNAMKDEFFPFRDTMNWELREDFEYFPYS
jgi:hypothetical protein